jgi:hypothetical protein
MQAFLKALRGNELRRIARQLPGYDARGAGELCPLDNLSEQT